TPSALAPTEASDRSLLARLRRGHQDAATQLYLRYAKRVQALVRARCSRQLARRVEPEDLVQSVFRRFFRRVLQGDYDVPPGGDLWGLFLVIALNRIRSEESFHRAGKRDVRLCALPDTLVEVEHGTEETAYLTLQMTVDEALGRLPPTHRAVLEMRIQGHE